MERSHCSSKWEDKLGKRFLNALTTDWLLDWPYQLFDLPWIVDFDSIIACNFLKLSHIYLSWNTVSHSDYMAGFLWLQRAIRKNQMTRERSCNTQAKLHKTSLRDTSGNSCYALSFKWFVSKKKNVFQKRSSSQIDISEAEKSSEHLTVNSWCDFWFEACDICA